MTQFAPVAPPQVLMALKDLGEHIIGRYHLLLAHDVVARPHEYKNLLPPGSFVIMDNSIIELGYPVDAETMQEALCIVPSQVVVLPDILGESDATIEMSFVAADKYRTLLDPKIMYMGVPQGRCLEELKYCAKEMWHIEGLGCWGIPRHITGLIGSRREFTKWIWDEPEMRLPAKPRGAFIHLLGFSDDMEDDILASHLPGVLGIDSAVPIRMGQNKQLISRLQQAHTPRKDWWDTATRHITAETIANLALIRNWVQFRAPVPVDS
jgi:hypothetical protein